MKYHRIAPLSFLLLAAFAARAESLVINGSLEGDIANMELPAGWVVLGGTPDTMDTTSNVGVQDWRSFAVAPTASPDGGTWVGLGITGNYIEQFGQSISGLTVGQTYTLSWQAANFGVNNFNNSYLGSNAIGVLLDGASIGQGAKLSLSSSWHAQSLSFVATSTSPLLSFRLANAEKAYLGIDGISLTAGGVTPAVPEPSGWVLMALGAVALGVARRRQS